MVCRMASRFGGPEVSVPTPFNLMRWIEEHLDEFRKPVGNKVVLGGQSEFIAFVSGANSRNDFHVNPGEEIFIQLKGDIRVDLIDELGDRVVNPVREGDVLLIPAGVPHAPRRPEGTWGFIVERHRKPGELDGFQWHCEKCNHKLHRGRSSSRTSAAVRRDAEGVRRRSTPARAACGKCWTSTREFRWTPRSQSGVRRDEDRHATPRLPREWPDLAAALRRSALADDRAPRSVLGAHHGRGQALPGGHRPALRDRAPAGGHGLPASTARCSRPFRAVLLLGRAQAHARAEPLPQ